MKLKTFIDNFTATSLAVIVHIALLGILVVSLDWTTPSMPPASNVEPVKAVVVDESQVAEEIEQIKKREEKKRKQEEKRAKALERGYGLAGHRLRGRKRSGSANCSGAWQRRSASTTTARAGCAKKPPSSLRK